VLAGAQVEVAPPVAAPAAPVRTAVPARPTADIAADATAAAPAPVRWSELQAVADAPAAAPPWAALLAGAALLFVAGLVRGTRVA
ncbi:hypothetical protein ACS2QA_28410, partial [Bacillus cereus group sp. Bce037]